MTEHGRRTHDRAGTALLDIPQTHLSEFASGWHPTRSLNPGRRAYERVLHQRPGRTDRGGRVADGGQEGDRA